MTDIASQRLLVIWPAFTGLDADQQRMTIAHELTHAALAPVTSGRVPGWLGEGVAMYVSGDRRSGGGGGAASAAGRRPAVRCGRSAVTALSQPVAIGGLRGKAQSAAYAYASAAAFLRRRALRPATGCCGLYDAFNREELAGEGPELADQAVRKVLGMPLTRLERDLRRWIVTPGLAMARNLASTLRWLANPWTTPRGTRPRRRGRPRSSCRRASCRHALSPNIVSSKASCCVAPASSPPRGCRTRDTDAAVGSRSTRKRTTRAPIVMVAALEACK